VSIIGQNLNGDPQQIDVEKVVYADELINDIKDMKTIGDIKKYLEKNKNKYKHTVILESSKMMKTINESENFRKMTPSELDGFSAEPRTQIDDKSSKYWIFTYRDGSELFSVIGTEEYVSDVTGLMQLDIEPVTSQADAQRIVDLLKNVSTYAKAKEALKNDGDGWDFKALNESDSIKLINITEGKSQGWMVSNDESGKLMIQKNDDSDKFKNDAEALAFVKKKAKEGSEKHIKALKRIETANKKKK
jgi:hypothetical protein